MIGDVLPAAYRFDVDHHDFAHAVLGKSTWAALAVTLDIELFTKLHSRRRIERVNSQNACFYQVTRL